MPPKKSYTTDDWQFFLQDIQTNVSTAVDPTGTEASVANQAKPITDADRRIIRHHQQQVEQERRRQQELLEKQQQLVITHHHNNGGGFVGGGTFGFVTSLAAAAANQLAGDGASAGGFPSSSSPLFGAAAASSSSAAHVWDPRKSPPVSSPNVAHAGNGTGSSGSNNSSSSSKAPLSARRSAPQKDDEGQAMLEAGRSRKIGTGVNAVRDSSGSLCFAGKKEDAYLSNPSAQSRSTPSSPSNKSPRKSPCEERNGNSNNNNNNHDDDDDDDDGHHEKEDAANNNADDFGDRERVRFGAGTGEAPPLTAQDLKDMAQRGVHAVTSLSAEIANAVLPGRAAAVVLHHAASAAAKGSQQYQYQQKQQQQQQKPSSTSSGSGEKEKEKK